VATAVRQVHTVTALLSSCAGCLEMWEPQPAGNTEGVSDCNGSVLCVKYFETWRCGVCVWCV